MVKDFDRKEVCVMRFCAFDKLLSVKSISDQRHQQSEIL